MHQRIDTYTRQKEKYNHSCCKKCFGKEQSFSDARKRDIQKRGPIILKHSEETKKKLSALRMGKPSWNKGLTKKDHPSIERYGKAGSAFKKANPLLGDKNPNWKGGIYKPPRVPEEINVWFKFRKEILERDVHKCWKCNDTKRLEVHHLASRAKHRELEYDEQNCIVLCRICHLEFHKKYGRKRFTYYDTIEWINESRSEEDRLVMC